MRVFRFYTKIISYKITKFIIIAFLFFGIPLLLSYLYIGEITIKKSTPEKLHHIIGITSDVKAASVPISSSTPSYILKATQEFSYFDQMVRYMTLFDIQPRLVRYSLYLDNSSIKAKINYKESYNDKERVEIFDSTLLCDGQLVETGKTNQKKQLIKSNLVLNEESDNDRNYIGQIIKACIAEGTIAFKNNLNKTTLISSINLLEGSEMVLIIEPQFSSKIIIYFFIIVFWIGLLILLREGPLEAYKKWVQSQKGK